MLNLKLSAIILINQEFVTDVQRRFPHISKCIRISREITILSPLPLLAAKHSHILYKKTYYMYVCSRVMWLRVKSVQWWCDGLTDRSLMADPLSYFSFQSVIHDFCNKGRGLCYPVCGMIHIKECLLLIGKSSQCGSLAI